MTRASSLRQLPDEGARAPQNADCAVPEFNVTVHLQTLFGLLEMNWKGYLVFGFFSLLLSALSVVFWMINPPTELFLFLAAPPLRLLGYHPPVESWSGLGSAMLVSFLWPLTLLPLHWLNFRVLRWKTWGYVGVLLFGNFVVALLVLLAREGS